MPVLDTLPVNRHQSQESGTKSEIYQIGAESGVNYLKNIGLELAEGIVDDASKR